MRSTSQIYNNKYNETLKSWSKRNLKVKKARDPDGSHATETFRKSCGNCMHLGAAVFFSADRGM